jgi:hypothetical protein
MTLIVLTIIAMIAFLFGLCNFFIFEKAAQTTEDVIAFHIESLVYIVAGIFILLLALLFKLNPFWG